LKSLSLSRMSTRSWLLIVSLGAVVERLLLYLTYPPLAYKDTDAYRRLAGQVLEGWATYDGSRMPGYPVFLAWLGADQTVYAVQLILGLLITLLFFYIGWRLTGKGWAAALFAAAYTLNPQQVLVEADLLSETLTIFFLALSLAALAALLCRPGRRPLGETLLLAGLAGTAAGLAALTRTLFIFLPVLAAVFLLIGWPKSTHWERWAAAAGVALAGLALIGAYVNFIHQRYDIWGLSTMNGYHMMNHAGQFFEYAPDEYAELRETYLRYRDAQQAETGSSSNAIWDAIPEMQQVSGLGFTDLSRLLGQICIRLIVEHPGLYLHSVFQGWLGFWKAPVHWRAITGPLAGAQQIAILGLRGALILGNGIFLLGTLALPIPKLRRRLALNTPLYLMGASVWAASIMQAMLEFGDNPRYSVPLQTLVLLLVGWGLIKIFQFRHLKRKPVPGKSSPADNDGRRPAPER